MNLKSFSSSLLATTVMTLFSNGVSAITKKEFNEPVLLGKLVRHFPSAVSKQQSGAIGWMTHYAVGLAFTAAYDLIWGKTSLRPTLLNGLWIGTASGMLGGYAWKKALDLHPNPPRIDMKEHYAQLVPAHVVFTLVDVLVRRSKAKGQ